MLKEFSVTNFKNFKTKLTFVLDKPSNYEFSEDVVQNGCVTKGIIYGINGSGKSNLALAIFDIILQLTDKEKLLGRYDLYKNLYSNKPTVDFEYLFEFNKLDVLYKYRKTDATTLSYESLTINGDEVLSYDFNRNEGYTNLEGAESLQLTPDMKFDQDLYKRLSRVKFVAKNALLANNETNKAFWSFISFVDNMLMFYSLDNRGYQGFRLGTDSFTQGIIRENKMKDFESFLHSHNINYDLVAVDVNGVEELYCKFPQGTIPFGKVASTGTISLALFYYWYIKMSKASFVYIDEFDAFYHYKLSQDLVNLVRGLKNTQIFMSTHNSDLLSNDILRPDAYFIIKNNHINAITNLTDKDLRKAHNIQKMFKAGSFD